MATVADLLTATAQRINILGAGQTLDSDIQTILFARLQDLEESWQTERLIIPYVLRTTFTLTANKGEPGDPFTVGTGGNVSVLRPTFINALNYQDTSLTTPNEVPLSLLTDDGYAAIPQKTLTGTYPVAAYYNPTYASGFGSLNTWPVQTSTTLQGVLYAPANIAKNTATTDSLVLPQGYLRFMRDNLAIEVWAEFREGQSPDPTLVRSAIESKASIKRINERQADLSIDPALIYPQGSIYNIWSDT